MERVMSRNGSCAIIRESGVGVEIEYLGQHHSFPNVIGERVGHNAALIPNWQPKVKIKPKCGPGKNHARRELELMAKR